MLSNEQIAIALLLVIIGWLLAVIAVTGKPYFRRRFKPLRRLWRKTKDRVPRLWQPKSPADCPHCVAGLQLQPVPRHRSVTPYSQLKSPRGRKKRIATAGRG